MLDKTKEFYAKGDVLCDMHYGLGNLPKNLEAVSHITLMTAIGREVVMTLNGGQYPGNKDLVVAGHSASNNNIVAVYNYSPSYFGLVELKYKKTDMTIEFIDRLQSSELSEMVTVPIGCQAGGAIQRLRPQYEGRRIIIRVDGRAEISSFILHGGCRLSVEDGNPVWK